MPGFAYRAIGPDGSEERGFVRAASREAAVAALRQRHAVPLVVEPARRAALGDIKALGGRGGATGPRPVGSKGRGREALIGFTRDLETLLGARVPAGRALEMLARQGKGSDVSVAGALLARVRAGQSLAAAMDADPGFFPDFYRGMVRAGEDASALSEVLGRIAEMLERAAALRAEIRSQLAYPVLVLMLSGATIALMLVHVVPQFAPVFAQSGGSPPPTTQAMLAASAFLGDWGWPIAASLAALALAARPLMTLPAVRRATEGAMLATPVVGALVRAIEAARFTRMLGTLAVNGVPLIEGARVATGALAVGRLAEATRAAVPALGRGEDLAQALGRAGWLPERSLQLVAVGVESGCIGPMLLKAAEIHEAEAARAARRLVAMIGPLTTILLGCLIGGIVWSIMDAVLGAYERAI